MKLPAILIALCVFTATVCVAQAAPGKKTAPTVSPAARAAAKACDDPDDGGGRAEGWPEAPVYILFHREKSKAPWARNPAIRVPGVETTVPAAAHSLVCVEEKLIEMGKYESGEPGYSPSWDVTIVNPSTRKVYLSRTGFYGKEPPGIKFNRGAGVGATPVKEFTEWLPLIVNQKVARFKTRLPHKEFMDIAALAFSADGTRLVVAQEPRSSSLGPTPPTPVVVYDLATAKPVASWTVDYLVRGLAISQTGTMVALGHYGHPEIWDVASAHLIHKLDANHMESLVFGPGDVLGVAGEGKAALWDVKAERMIASGAGSRIALSPSGEWLALNGDAGGVNVVALQSGRTVASFPGVKLAQDDKYGVSGDLQSLVRTSYLSSRMTAAGSRDEKSPELPSAGGIGLVNAFVPLRDGFVFANDGGILGVASFANPQARAFATDHSRITALAISPDYKLLAIGDSGGDVSVWELR